MAFEQNNSPFQKQKGGGTTKACLPLAKIRSMSKSEKDKVVRAKRKAGKAGKYKRDSKTNVKVQALKVARCVIGLKKKTGGKYLTLVKNVVKNEIF